MDITIISKRYAAAFFSLAKEQNQLEQAYQDMLLVAEIVKNNKNLSTLLKSPIIPLNKKLRIISAVFENQISKTSLRFLELVLRKERAFLIQSIAESFVEQYQEFKNIVTVNLVTAVPLNSETKNEILKKLSTATHKTINLAEKVQPEIIGGFILNFNHHYFDASLRRQIDLLRKDFKKNPYIREY
ncbi:MAG: ATP synthase F1 subunit delta [Sphingobacteriia bacterium]|nr:ATP synthase F1 subunit delta [Sphingobacteriia bacterium]